MVTKGVLIPMGIGSLEFDVDKIEVRLQFTFRAIYVNWQRGL
jgi:hypothetical protein